MKTAAAEKSGRLRREARNRACPSWPCRDVSAIVVGGTSGLAGTFSFSVQIGPHLFLVRVVPLDPLTLGATAARFLTPCRTAEC
jgi:hypothetical protein